MKKKYTKKDIKKEAKAHEIFYQITGIQISPEIAYAIRKILDL